MSQARTLIGIPELQAWIASGGVARAGMTASSLNELLKRVAAFSVTAQNLTTLLLDIRSAWADVGGDNSLKAALETLLPLLADATDEAKEANTRAWAVKVEANKVYGTVDRRIQSHSGKRQKLSEAIVKSKQRIHNAEKQLKKARDKLNFGDALLHSLETLVTFGAIDKNRENLNKIKSSITTMQAEAVSQKANALLIDTYTKELTALRNGIARIVDLDHAMTDFQNTLSAASGLVLEAYGHIDTAQSSDDLDIAQFSIHSARPHMDDLLSWIDRFALTKKT